MQNRVTQALPRLPEDVRQIGVTTEKSSPNLTMVVHLVSPGRPLRRAVPAQLRASCNVRDELLRIPGVGQVLVFGAGDYAMRVWLDPDKLAARGLTAGDVVRAIREQNVAGRRRRGRRAAGARPAPSSSSPSTRRAGWPPRRSSATSSSRPTPRRRADAARGRRPRRARRRRPTRCAACSTTSRRWRIADLPGAGLERARSCRTTVRATMEELKHELPAGRGLPDRLRPDASSCATSIETVVETLFEAIAAGGARRGAVPADLARVDHPAAGGAGVDRRHVRGAAGCSASRSTRCRCSAWCSPSASWSTTPSSWSRTSSATSRRACRRATPRIKAMEEVSGPDHRDRAGAVRGVRADGLHAAA